MCLPSTDRVLSSTTDTVPAKGPQRRVVLQKVRRLHAEGGSVSCMGCTNREVGASSTKRTSMQRKSTAYVRVNREHYVGGD